MGSLLALPGSTLPHTPASPLASSSGQGGSEDWPLGLWAGTFLSADEVRQGWLPTDLSPQCQARHEPVRDRSVSSSRQPGSVGAGTQGPRRAGAASQLLAVTERIAQILRHVIGQRGYSRQRNSLGKGSEEEKYSPA